MRYTWLDDVLLNTLKWPSGIVTIASTNTSEEMNSKTAHVITAVFSIMAGLKLLKEIFLLL